MHLCIFAPMHFYTYAFLHLCIFASLHYCIFAFLHPCNVSESNEREDSKELRVRDITSHRNNPQTITRLLNSYHSRLILPDIKLIRILIMLNADHQG